MYVGDVDRRNKFLSFSEVILNKTVDSNLNAMEAIRKEEAVQAILVAETFNKNFLPFCNDGSVVCLHYAHLLKQ